MALSVHVHRVSGAVLVEATSEALCFKVGYAQCGGAWTAGLGGRRVAPRLRDHVPINAKTASDYESKRGQASKQKHHWTWTEKFYNMFNFGDPRRDLLWATEMLWIRPVDGRRFPSQLESFAHPQVVSASHLRPRQHEQTGVPARQ